MKTPLKICFYIKVHIRFIGGVILSFLYSQLENIKKHIGKNTRNIEKFSGIKRKYT